jgi:uroporphyrinogen decarboxylase
LDAALPYLKKVITKVEKEKGLTVSVHICGNITNRLDLIPEIGAKNISFDYKVDIAKARKILKGKMTFSGNMNPVTIMQNATPEGVAAACRECIRKAGDDSSFILMPGCDIPPTVPVENVIAMVQTACNY